MKRVIELKPGLPRYSEIWDDNVVLDYLKTFADINTMTLKKLTLKLTMLLCLTTGQRGQTIHKINVNCIQELPDRCRIIVNNKLKQTKSGGHQKPLEICVFDEDHEICVVRNLQEYLRRTKQRRKQHSQLLLSYIKPFKPVSKDIISSWVKQVYKSAGVDIEQYSAHSMVVVQPRHPIARRKDLI